MTTRRRVVSYAVMVAFAVFFLFPLVFMVVGSLKPDEDVLSDGSSWRAFWPAEASLDNYGDAFARANVDRLFLNSVIITTPIVVAGLVVNSLFGYALARLRWTGRRAALLGVVALTIVPFQAIAVPLFFLVSKLGWVDTYYVQILPFIASPFFIFLFYSFFLGLPRELEESARIDGAGPLRIFFGVVAPLAKPAYATVAILSFLLAWGELLWPVFVTRGEEVRPLPLGVSEFQNLPPIQWGDIMAFTVLMTAPLLVLFVVFQRAFVRGVASTGLKG
jgi:multiple sugar transport system permease protein